MSVTPEEIEIATRVARQVGSKWSLVEIDDLASELTLWLFEHQENLERYRGVDYGRAQLITALRRAAWRYSTKEQRVRSGGPLVTDDAYTYAQIERGLPFMFEAAPESIAYENPNTGAARYSGEPGLAQIVMMDIRAAYAALDEQHSEVIWLRFRDGFTYREIANLLGVSDTAAKKRVKRAIESMIRYLSGS